MTSSSLGSLVACTSVFYIQQCGLPTVLHQLQMHGMSGAAAYASALYEVTLRLPACLPFHYAANASHSKRGLVPWTAEEDAALLEFVTSNGGPGKWRAAEQLFPGRSSSSIYERWRWRYKRGPGG